MRVKEYKGPLGVLAAGVVGFSLLCSVSAMAMGDLRNRSSATLAPLNIINLAVNNFSTAAAFTEQAVTQFVATPTAVPTNTASLTPVPSNTSTSVRFVTITPTLPRRPRAPLPVSTSISIPTRTNTSVPPATNTVIPTDTPQPPPTDTSMPPTDTPQPPPTDTQQPTDTNVPPTEAPPTATNVPVQVPIDGTSIP